MKNTKILFKRCTPDEFPKVAELWYEVSLIAHDFISQEFWGKNKRLLASEYLPAAETLLAIQDGDIVGFISLIDDHLPALFVSTRLQGKGIGTRLLARAKRNKQRLYLKVYKKNKKSLRFYHRQGFRIVAENTDPATGEREFLMEWRCS